MRILFINLTNSSFVRNDQKILAERHQLKPFLFRHKKGFKLIPELIREALFTLRYVFSHDVVYIWFADFHAVIPALIGRFFGKKVVIVIGGFDAAYIKEYNYGVKARRIGRISVQWSTKLATHLLAVTEFSKQELLDNINSKLEKKTTIIHNCVNDFFTYDAAIPKKEQAICLSLGASVNRMKIKGVDYFVEMAKAFPQKHFVLVGPKGDAKKYIEELKPQNLQLIEAVPHHDLVEYLAASKVICQFSRYESFGIALLEGISCGCFPVGNNYAGTAEVLKDTEGFLVDIDNVESGISAMDKAFSKSIDDVMKIDTLMKERFAFKVRADKLLSFMDGL